MIIMVYNGDMWQEVAKISVQAQDESVLELQNRTEEIGFSGGDKSVSLKTLVNGGNMIKYDAGTMMELSFKFYPEMVNTITTSDAEGLAGYFLGEGDDYVDPQVAIMKLKRYNFKVVVAFSDLDVSAHDSFTYSVPNAGKKMLRFIATNARLTDIQPSFDDKEYSQTFVFQFPLFRRLGDITGTATGGSTTTLVDSGATFTNEGLQVGQRVENVTKGKSGFISAITNDTTLTFSDGFEGGVAFELNDDYKIYAGNLHEQASVLESSDDNLPALNVY